MVLGFSPYIRKFFQFQVKLTFNDHKTVCISYHFMLKLQLFFLVIELTYMYNVLRYIHNSIVIVIDMQSLCAESKSLYPFLFNVDTCLVLAEACPAHWVTSIFTSRPV